MNKVLNNGFTHRLKKHKNISSTNLGFSGQSKNPKILINENDQGNFYNLLIKINETTGYGYFSGNVDINGTPATMKIKLYIAGTKILVQETESLSHNGYFEFNNIADNAVYDMYAIPKDGMYETKVKENITCLKDYKRIVNFNIVGVSKAPPINSRGVRFTMIALNTINKPKYDIKNAPDWLNVDKDSGLCYGTPNKYIQSLIINCVVYDGDNIYEFNRTVNFDDTRFVIEYNNNIKDSFNVSEIKKDIVLKNYVDFPKGGKALAITNDYIQYQMIDDSFQNIKSGSYTLEITCNVKRLTNHGVIFSSDKIGKSRFVVGYKIDKLYFIINGQTIYTNNIFSQVSINQNSWFVLTICKSGSVYYGFYNGVLIHQWYNDEYNVISNNLFVGDNKIDNDTDTDIIVRKIKFIKNISEYDDTYSTEYSFVDEAIAFPKYVFTHIDNITKPNGYIDAVLYSNTIGTENPRVYFNNFTYYANPNLGSGTSSLIGENQHKVILPSYDEIIDLGTSNWTIHFDIMLCKEAIWSYNTANMTLLSNLTKIALFRLYLKDGLNSRRIEPFLVINDTTISFNSTTKSSRRISLLKRNYITVSRKKNYLYLFLDGILLNKISTSTSKTFSFIGKNNLISLGHNTLVSNAHYYYTDVSTQGIILRKNMAVTESFDINDSISCKYHTIKFGYNNYVDEYFDGKFVVNGIETSSDRYIRNMSTSKATINDVYNINDVLTVRITGTTISSDIIQNLLTLKNSQSGEYYKFYTDKNGIVFKSLTNAINVTYNTNKPKSDNEPFDIVLSSDGYNIYIQIDGIVVAHYEISHGSTIFDVCYIGCDESGIIQYNSSSAVALFQQSFDIYFKDNLKVLDKNEYQQQADFKLLYHNPLLDDSSTTPSKNLYTGEDTQKVNYGHKINEINSSNVKPIGDWTMEMVYSSNTEYNSYNQYIYTSYHSSTTATAHIVLYINTQRRLCVSYSALQHKTNDNGVTYSYIHDIIYDVGENIHISLVRSGDYFKIFINGVMVRYTVIKDFMPFFDYTSKGINPSLSYDSTGNYYPRGDMKYFRIINGIALYQDSFDPTNALNNIPSEGITSFPTTTSLPSRYKITKP